MLAIDFQGAVKIAPLILGSIRRNRPQSAQRPAPAHHGNQTVAVFIGYPDPHGFSTSYGQAPELCAERLLKLGGSGRVLLRVSLARHLQDSAQFSQPVIHSLQTELGLVLLLQPLLNLPGPLPPPILQACL